MVAASSFSASGISSQEEPCRKQEKVSKQNVVKSELEIKIIFLVPSEQTLVQFDRLL